MLTKEEYLTKHTEKFLRAGLSKAEKSRRYQQYKQSFAMKTRGVVGRSKQSAEPFRENRVLNTSYSSFSQCTKDYANALIDPWSVPRPPCVPDNITLPSFKFGARARGTFIVGTAGTGFIINNPYITSNDQAAGFSTDATFGSPDIEGGGVTGVNPYFNDSPFEAVDFGDLKNQARLVGAGLKVRYTGTEINRSGQCVSFRSPTNRDPLASGPITNAQLLSYKESASNPVDRDWHYAVYRPSTPTDLAYANPNNLQSNFCLVVGVFGAQPGQSFEFDYVSWFETVGSNMPNLTRSHSDPIGMSAVSMAMPATQPTRSPSTSLRDFMHEMAAGVATAMSFMPVMPGTAGNIQRGISNTATLGAYLL